MELALDIIGERFTTLYQMSKPTYLSRDVFAPLEIGILTYSVWARTTNRGVSLPVSGQRLIMFFGKLILSRTQNDVIAVWIL